MGLSADLLSEFSKVTKDSSDKKNKESTLFGTAVEYNGKMYVKLDGSELLTPVSTTAVIESGERVTVLLKNHNATVTGNLSSPSVRKGTVDALDGEVKELGTQITEFEIVIADKISTQELEAEKARIDELVSENVVIRGTLTANEADISDLKADNVTINETLVANQADIESLQTTKLDAEIADITYATIDDLDATNADIHNLDADFGDFKVLTAESFSALDATIKELDAQKLSATEAEITYANIDFSNIGKAAMENLYANSGLIRDVIIDNGTITGHLVGVTISGDLIEGNTIIAEKLVIKGDDGLYYKLNTDGVTTEAEQTDYNSLDGSVIKAKSITATKVSVEDLVAFDATIGGFKITDSAIYSGVKETADNSTRGIYLNKTGQIAIGDSTNYLKYYKDQNGVYKLEISAGSIKLSSSNKTVETALSEMIVSSVEEFYQSSSSSSLSGGSWSASQPAWVDGTYIWRRTKVTYGDGHSDYSPSTTGVCITGNTGAEGPQGESGVNGVGVSSVDVQYYKSTSSTSLVGGTWQTTNPGWENGKYIWSKTVVTYTDSSTDESSPVCLTGSTGSTGASGSDGSDGNDGVGVSTIVEQYYQSSSSSSLSGGSWTNSYPGWVDGKFIWTRSVITYTNGKSTTTSAVCVTGSKGATGAQGEKGETGEAGKGIASVVEYYAVSSSNSTAPSSWSTTVQTMTSTNKYLWNYEVITYTDSSTSETKKRVIGAYGNTGDTGVTGATGKGIKSIANYYLATASSSGVTTSTSGWSTSVQSVSSSKKYLWNYEVITYTDNTTVSTSPCIIGAYGDTGAQGEKGDTGKGVKSITNYYLANSSSSGVTTSTSGWSTSVQSVSSSKKYLWNYEVITYTDNTTVSTSPCIIGAYGDTGATGATGRGISSITEYYLVSSSSSGVTTSTSGWSTDISTTTTTNKYLWNYEKITYTDSTSVNTTPKIIGTHGATGDTGNGISKTEVYYYLSTSSTAQSGGSWSTTVPDWVDGRYYWQKIKTTYTNSNTSESTPVCITGAKGATGATGSTGTGVESITTEFYLSSSKTTQTGGSWSTTMPTWSSGMYLWTRNKVVYKNPSSTVYTTPICDSSWEAVNEIQIGGRNLIRGTKNFKIDDTQTVGWKNTGSWSLETDDEGFTVVSKSQTDQTSNNIPSIYSSRFPVSLGDVLIYSCWFKVDDVDVWDGLKSPYIFEGYDSSNTRVQYQDVSIFVTNSNRPTVTSGEWVYFYSTHTITDESVVKAGMRLTLFRNGSIHIKKCKVEKGNKPTDWTPAPEDVEQNINDTANDIYQEISDQSTNIISDCEAIILEATKNYTKTSDFDSFKETVNSQLTLLADELTAKFTQTTEDIENVNGDLQEKFNTITKYFTFDINGLTIGQEDNPNKVVIDNDEISILVNGSTVQKFDANGNALIPDLKVTTSLNLFGYSITQDSSGNVNCAYVGGE